MIGTIPNRGLIRYLIDNYYQGGGNSQETDFVSSHWKYYSGLFNVELDSKGSLVALSGTGFGTYKSTSLIHRILDQLCMFSHLLHLPHRKEIIRLLIITAKICNTMGFDLTFDVFRQVCSVELIKRKLPRDMIPKRMYVLMIGDGYGILSALFKSIFPNSTLVMIDIGKTLLFQAHYCQKAHPNCVHKLASRVTDLDSADFIYCPVEHLEKIARFEFDGAVNIASMQEMDIVTIAQYFDFFRQNFYVNNFFYCCNRESKTLKGGEVSKFMEYPWQDGDRYVIDGYCPWHKYFFSPKRSKNGLRLFGIRVPFVNYYDGKHMHRLAVLTCNK
jgi:hypothetical protein